MAQPVALAPLTFMYGAHPRGFAIVFFLGGLFPTPELLIDLIYVFCYIFFYPYESKTTRFHNFYERFPEFIERRIMDVIM